MVPWRWSHGGRSWRWSVAVMVLSNGVGTMCSEHVWSRGGFRRLGWAVLHGIQISPCALGSLAALSPQPETSEVTLEPETPQTRNPKP